MLSAYAAAISQLSDPAFRRVFWRALALTVGVFIGLGVVCYFVLQWAVTFEAAWIEWLADLGLVVGLIVLMVILFPAVATGFIGIFLDDIAAAVEQKHYPLDPPGRELPFWPAFGLSLRFTLVVIALNVLALPVYILAIWIPFLNLFVFYGMNGYLLGREYFELVGYRQLDEARVRALRKRHARRVFFTGAAAAFLLTVPLVNLIAPIVATAAMVHVFKRLEQAQSVAA